MYCFRAMHDKAVWRVSRTLKVAIMGSRGHRKICITSELYRIKRPGGFQVPRLLLGVSQGRPLNPSEFSSSILLVSSCDSLENSVWRSGVPILLKTKHLGDFESRSIEPQTLCVRVLCWDNICIWRSLM